MKESVAEIYASVNGIYSSESRLVLEVNTLLH